MNVQPQIMNDLIEQLKITHSTARTAQKRARVRYGPIMNIKYGRKDNNSRNENGTRFVRQNVNVKVVESKMYKWKTRGLECSYKFAIWSQCYSQLCETIIFNEVSFLHINNLEIFLANNQYSTLLRRKFISASFSVILSLYSSIILVLTYGGCYYQSIHI